MRKTAAEGFKNFAADGICLQIVADAKYAGDRRRAPQEGAALLDAATLRKVSCIAGAGQRGKPSVKHEDTSEGCIEVRPFRSVGFCRSTSRSYHKNKKNNRRFLNDG